MALEVWFQLVDGEGKVLVEVFAVTVTIDAVYAFLREVKTEFRDSYLAGIPRTDLTVFADREAYNAHQKLSDILSPLTALGLDEDNRLIVEVPARRRVDTDEGPPQKARTWTVIEDKVIKSIEQNLDIDAWSVGGINLNIHKVEPDFPEWFYVRKQTQDIVKVFKALMEEDLHVVFVGTPGVGKSMLVVVFAFYMALILKKRVVLFRKLAREACSLLYLDGEKKRYWRKDEAVINDIADLENREFELCLDGLDYTKIRQNNCLERFRLLATPVKNDDVRLSRWLVPFWSLSDLDAIGAHQAWSKEEIKDRYFYSGGNLHDFTSR